MIFSLKNIIWGLFGIRDDANDINKIDGRGFHQRTVEMMAENYDSNEGVLLNNIVANTQAPKLFQAKFVRYREATFDLPIISNDIAVRRKLVQYARPLNARRGTIKGYTFLFKLMGFTTVTLTEYANSHGFDSDITLDNEVRRFDQKCKQCSYYSLDLEGPEEISSELEQYIANVIEYNEPIFAERKYVKYNGVELYLIIGTPGDFSDDFNEDYFN